jgi:hypothetical protein
MNKKLIILLIMVFAIGSLSAHLYRDDSGRWYSQNKKTGVREYIFSTRNTSDPLYREREYPYQRDSELTSFRTSDRTYVDQTNRDMGNRP